MVGAGVADPLHAVYELCEAEGAREDVLYSELTCAAERKRVRISEEQDRARAAATTRELLKEAVLAAVVSVDPADENVRRLLLHGDLRIRRNASLVPATLKRCAERIGDRSLGFHDEDVESVASHLQTPVESSRGDVLNHEDSS